MACQMRRPCSIVWVMEHFALELGRHPCLWASHASWGLSDGGADIVLVVARGLLPDWLVWGGSERPTWLGLVHGWDWGLVDSSGWTSRPRASWHGIIGTFRDSITLFGRASDPNTDLALLTHGSSCGLELVSRPFGWLLPQRRVVKHWGLELFLCGLLLLLMALSVASQARVLPRVHHCEICIINLQI